MNDISNIKCQNDIRNVSSPNTSSSSAFSSYNPYQHNQNSALRFTEQESQFATEENSATSLYLNL